jgi:hypothetical protein
MNLAHVYEMILYSFDKQVRLAVTRIYRLFFTVNESKFDGNSSIPLPPYYVIIT